MTSAMATLTPGEYSVEARGVWYWRSETGEFSSGTHRRMRFSCNRQRGGRGSREGVGYACMCAGASNCSNIFLWWGKPSACAVLPHKNGLSCSCESAPPPRRSVSASAWQAERGQRANRPHQIELKNIQGYSLAR